MIPSSRHLVTTTPRKARCNQCRRTVLDGIEMGAPYRVDAIPITVEGELHARLRGLLTYRILARRIALREALDIAADHTKGRPPVCAVHDCTPVNPGHIDARHVGAFSAITVDAPAETPEQSADQDALFVITGRFAGARVIAVPAADDCPF